MVIAQVDLWRRTLFCCSKKLFLYSVSVGLQVIFKILIMIFYVLGYLHLIHTNQTLRIQTVFLFLHLYDVRHTALITSTQVNCESHKARVKE